MSDTHIASGDEGASASITVIPTSGEGPLSVSQAARDVVAQRRKLSETPAEPARAPKEPAAAEPPQELAEEANAAPVEEQVPGETQEAEPAEQPPIEPPRSWTKEAKERWQSLPRETQEYLSEREQERDREVRRSQNETAEKLKGLTAKEQAVEQAKQRYESALPALLQTLQEQQAGEFAEIKTTADVNKLAAEDPFRFAQWQARQMQIAAVAQEAKAAEARQRDEYQKRWTDFATKEDQKLLERVPELADKTKAAKLQDDAISVLRDLEFNDQELADLYHGKASISLRDARIQQLILSAVKLKDAQEAAKKAQAKPVPPVQRPGVAPPRGTSDDQQIQALKQKLDRTGSLKDAAALLNAQRRARRA